MYVGTLGRSLARYRYLSSRYLVQTQNGTVPFQLAALSVLLRRWLFAHLISTFAAPALFGKYLGTYKITNYAGR